MPAIRRKRTPVSRPNRARGRMQIAPLCVPVAIAVLSPWCTERRLRALAEAGTRYNV
jgi:hypothetical protein